MHVLFVCTHMDVCITMYIYMQVLNGCLAVTEFVSSRLTSVYMYLHACTVLYAHTWMCACTMYIYIPYMQVLNGCLAVTEFVSGRLTSVYMYLHACTVCIHTWTYACTMYIFYMQVLNGCLAASDEHSWCPETSVYIYMYLQLCTVQLYAHTWTYKCTFFTCRCSVGVSRL